MKGEINFSQVIIIFFYGKSYDLWILRIQTDLKGLDLLEVVEYDYMLNSLRENLSSKSKCKSKERQRR